MLPYGQCLFIPNWSPTPSREYLAITYPALNQHTTNEMPSVHEISYSHSESVAAIRGYYAFLTSMYLDESAVEYPPEEGRPAINPESLRGLGKTYKVISLLRQIPYLVNEGSDIWILPDVLPAMTFATRNRAAICCRPIEPQVRDPGRSGEPHVCRYRLMPVAHGQDAAARLAREDGLWAAFSPACLGNGIIRPVSVLARRAVPNPRSISSSPTLIFLCSLATRHKAWSSRNVDPLEFY